MVRRRVAVKPGWGGVGEEGRAGDVGRPCSWFAWSWGESEQASGPSLEICSNFRKGFFRRGSRFRFKSHSPMAARRSLNMGDGSEGDAAAADAAAAATSLTGDSTADADAASTIAALRAQLADRDTTADADAASTIAALRAQLADRDTEIAALLKKSRTATSAAVRVAGGDDLTPIRASLVANAGILKNRVAALDRVAADKKKQRDGEAGEPGGGGGGAGGRAKQAAGGSDAAEEDCETKESGGGGGMASLAEGSFVVLRLLDNRVRLSRVQVRWERRKGERREGDGDGMELPVLPSEESGRAGDGTKRNGRVCYLSFLLLWA